MSELRPSIEDVKTTASIMKQMREGAEHETIHVGGKSYKTMAGSLKEVDDHTQVKKAEIESFTAAKVAEVDTHTQVKKAEANAIVTQASLDTTAALNTFKAYNPRGGWVTNTPYVPKDLFVDGGTTYLVIEGHISSTVATDIAAGKVVVFQGDERLVAEVASQIKGQWYPSVSPSISDHGASNGTDYDAGSIRKTIDQAGLRAAVINLAGDVIFTSDFTWPQNKTLDLRSGATIVVDGCTLTLNCGILSDIRPDVFEFRDGGKVEGDYYFIETPTVPTLTVIRNSPGSMGQTVMTLSYETLGDGGGATWEYQVSAVTGAYRNRDGEIIVPKGGDGSSAWIRLPTPIVSAKSFGINGDGCDGDAIQKHWDYCERVNAFADYRMIDSVTTHRTLFLGDIKILTHGCLWIIDRTSWTKAYHTECDVEVVMVNEAAILTKSVNIDIPPIKMSFDEWEILTIRPTIDSNTPNTCLRLYNTNSVIGDRLVIRTPDTDSDVPQNPLDFYAGVQGVTIGTVDITRNLTPETPGGWWLRNFSNTRYTGDINIKVVKLRGGGADESFAIFSSTSVMGDICNINIGHIYLSSPGVGAVFSVYDTHDQDPKRMRNINIASIDIDIEDVGKAWSLMVKHATPKIGNIHVTVGTVYNSNVHSPLIFATSAIPIPVGIMTINIDNTTDDSDATIVWGKWDIKHLNISSPATFRHALYGLHRVGDGNINVGGTREYTAFGCDEVHADITGEIQNVKKYSGTLSTDGGRTSIMYSEDTQGSALEYNAKIVSTTDVVPIIINPTTPAIVSVKGVVSVPNGKTVNPSFAGDNCNLVEWNFVKIIEGVAIRETAPKLVVGPED